MESPESQGSEGSRRLNMSIFRVSWGGKSIKTRHVCYGVPPEDPIEGPWWLPSSRDGAHHNAYVYYIYYANGGYSMHIL
jgi:hypothetical protein